MPGLDQALVVPMTDQPSEPKPVGRDAREVATPCDVQVPHVFDVLLGRGGVLPCGCCSLWGDANPSKCFAFEVLALTTVFPRFLSFQ
jgi:hypothetical protein